MKFSGGLRRNIRTWSVLLAIAVIGGLAAIVYLHVPPSNIRQLTAEDITRRLAELDPNSEQAATLRALFEQTENAQAASNIATKEFNELGIQFSYNGSYERREREGASVIFVAGAGGARRLTVSREQMSGAFEEFPAIRLRRLKPETYTERELMVHGASAIEFTNRDVPFEKTLFISRGGEVVIIALSSLNPFGAHEAEMDYDAVLASLSAFNDL